VVTLTEILVYFSINIYKWYFEKSDTDMLEIGKDIESIINLPFDFYELKVNDK